ncbi:DUF6213 family protein [Streptomyces sp. NPDC000229]|uniref:DUF6213 family protein n=1 Tax=Streptomyces sp. NPDC000229 TaxID=3154247 RepID=UPI003318E392
MSREVVFGLQLGIDSGGRLHVPADEVSGMLRSVSAQWQEVACSGGADLDWPTVVALSEHLDRLADGIDTSCLERLPARQEGDR